ncbi:MAG: hypothetical protein V4683_05700 [Bacteroidota bacterium]
MNDIRIGRALKLEGLENARNKVTIGFKADAVTKIQLAKEANECGLTLSEYIDYRLSQRNDDSFVNSIKEVIVPDPKTLADLAIAQRMYQNAINKVKFYENDFLQNAFRKYQGQSIKIEKDGTIQEVVINSLEDTYIAILSTLKLK